MRLDHGIVYRHIGDGDVAQVGDGVGVVDGVVDVVVGVGLGDLDDAQARCGRRSEHLGGGGVVDGDVARVRRRGEGGVVEYPFVDVGLDEGVVHRAVEGITDSEAVEGQSLGTGDGEPAAR